MRVGLDVGGTKTDAVIIDDDVHILARTRLATGWGVDAVGATIARAVDLVCGEAGIAREDIRSVGVGMPGQVAPGSTRVAHAVNLGVRELDVTRTLEPILGIPVRVENDVKAAALGAHALHGSGSGTMAYLNLGTGVAAGIVVEGQVWRGAGGSAGEVGHISIDPAGPPCRCGQRGCIEALAGGGAVAERWGRPGALPVRDVFDAADAGDALAVALRDDLARGVASAIRVLVLTADVDTVVIGGGLSALGDRLTTPVAAELEAGAEASAFIRSLRLRERATLLPAGSPAAALGAALVGRTTEEVLAHG
ncbi:ROK family protein [Microbacterium aquimaris]|uniref:ROK family protein n=1 Tax=Microbacterium aquimaris TaxID=459816 RepID=A0ABU5N609_9MICO|nr:ROK family protein [Microbacterium aquimaris]MDZ8161445.1 ROK family protein [Microbacterium aquimaris]